ncbi:hypothetical protein CWC29_001035 [Pseudoalteromonas sp. S4498]|uniref:glycosyltransferase family 2 protein n=1 Tax=Pseudoalteromonas galatheae TaxID=579562 RepID=UPI001109EE4E|nr:hypothetical protein [Pseudoalteromonas galatheae]NKC17437.1 hypothetical protein [Pseudoalteromonas galatheae]
MSLEFDTAILVLLYNKEISESDTLNSLLRSKIKYKNARLVIWNNGPKALKFKDVSQFQQVGYEVVIEETIENHSLAAIYNRFIRETTSEKYIFLDDDSQLNEGYIDASAQAVSDRIAMPLIKSSGQVVNPVINGRPANPSAQIGQQDKVITIGSGLIVGKDIANKLEALFGSVFDERFYLYGVDTTFCFRVFLAKLSEAIVIIPGFEHSLSRHQKESAEVIAFRRLERSYDLGLTLRYYTPLVKQLIILTKVCSDTLAKRLFHGQPTFDLAPLFKALFSGKHYRKR